MKGKSFLWIIGFLATCLSANAKIVPPPSVPEPAGFVAGAAMLGILGAVIYMRRRTK